MKTLVIDPARASDHGAVVTIAFENGMPTSVNEVQMALPDLIECLAVIAGLHGVSYSDDIPAPAAAVLRAAYASATSPTTTVRLTLHKGRVTVASAPDAEMVLVAQP
jgi:argininosuccinate synthase